MQHCGWRQIVGKKDDNPAVTGCAVVLMAVLLLVGGVNWVRDQLTVGHSVDGDDAVEAVDNAVHEAYSDEPWYERIESVKGGTLADLKIYTDFDASRQEDMKGAVAVCEAYAGEIKSDNPYVLVYGSSTEYETRIDGSREKEVLRNAKLARARADGTCGEAGILR